MKPSFSEKFDKKYHQLPEVIQRKFDKQLTFLLRDLRHPSLRAKKYSESGDIWQARVDNNWRFYFCIEGDTYILVDIIEHPK